MDLGTLGLYLEGCGIEDSIIRQEVTLDIFKDFFHLFKEELWKHK